MTLIFDPIEQVIIRGIRSKSRGVWSNSSRWRCPGPRRAACDAVPVYVDRSDHSLLHWPVTSDRPTIPSVTVRTRSRRRLDVDLFRSRLASSDLCLPSSWQPTSMCPRHCTTTSSQEFLTKFFRLAFNCCTGSRPNFDRCQK